MVSAVFLFSCLSLIFGSALSCFIQKTTQNFVTGLGFSAGIMLYMALQESLMKSDFLLEQIYSPLRAGFYTTVLFCLGMFLTVIIDGALNDVNIKRNNTERIGLSFMNKIGFVKMFVFTLIAITVHNMPEGLYAVYSLRNNPDAFYAIISPLILHNIIEGFSIGFPISCLSNSFKKTMILSSVISIICTLSIVIIAVFIDFFIDFRVLALLIVLSSASMLYVIFNYILPFCQKYTKYNYFIFTGIVLGLISMMSIVDVAPFLIRFFESISAAAY